MNWYGNVQRMDEEWLPRKILEWCPPRRRRRRRPRICWMQEVTKEIRERRVGSLEWFDREGWRRKIRF